jgi:DNA polymerase-4
MARGEDSRPVDAGHARKSISIEDTFAVDELGFDSAWTRLLALAEGLERRMMTESASGRTLVLKVKYADFHQITRSRTSDRPIRERDDFLPELKELLAETEVALKPFRLLGIGVTNLLSGTEVQGLLPFPECPI